MKKRYLLAFAIQAMCMLSPTIQAQSWLDTCKIYLASSMVTAVNTIMEMAARDLAMQGDPQAAKILMEIQQNKSARQLACEAGTEMVGGIFNQLLASIAVSPAIKSAIKSALDAAAYKVLHESIQWMF